MVSDGSGTGGVSARRVLTARPDLAGGKKSDTQTGSNGSSWSTKDPCLRRLTSLFQATLDFTTTVRVLPHARELFCSRVVSLMDLLPGFR